jgi:hypothetical protein
VTVFIHLLLAAPAFFAGLLAAFFAGLLAAAFCGVAWAEPAATGAAVGAAFLATLLAPAFLVGLLVIFFDPAAFFETLLTCFFATPALAIKGIRICSSQNMQS